MKRQSLRRSHTHASDEEIELLLESGLVSATGVESFPTWDPILNEVNYQTGTKQSEPVPTFGISELVELLAPRRTIARQIDHLFYSPDFSSTSTSRALDRDLDGMFPSDHFGVLTTLRVESTPIPNSQ